MGKSRILIILIIIIILAVGGFYVFNNHNVQENQNVKVGDAIITLPSGFHEVNSTEDGVKISDDTSNLMIFNYDDNEIDKYVSQYNDSKSQENISVIISNFTVGNYWVYKANTVNDPYILHYWFAFDHKIYSIYTEDGNKNTDKVVSDLIKSMKKA